jgi:biopolymer transport protein ExbD
MKRLARIIAATLAAFTGIALILIASQTERRSSQGIKVWLATSSNASTCADNIQLIHVLPGSLELNNDPVTARELEARLREKMRNRVERVAFVKGDDNTPFAEVVQVLSLIRGLQLQPVMMPYVLDAGCLVPIVPSGDSRNFVAPEEQQKKAFRAWMQPVPWWRIW